MHLKIVGALLLLLSAPAAHSALISCHAGAASTPLLDPLSTSAALGAYTLACSGGSQTDPMFTADFQSFFNAPLLQTDTPILTDGVNDYAGSFTGLSSISFAGIPFNPFSSRFAIRQVLVNPSLQTEGFQFIEFLSIVGATAVSIFEPQQVVAINGNVPVSVPEPSAGLLFASGMRRFALDPTTSAAVVGAYDDG